MNEESQDIIGIVGGILGLGWHVKELIHAPGALEQIAIGASTFGLLFFVSHRAKRHTSRTNQRRKKGKHGRR